ncbi:cupin [Deltaproteobacteria bacterium Smac51]|nr:cupin [Deltaproteobacteria bacterium Smac51]
MRNIFSIDKVCQPDNIEEQFETILTNDKGLLVERIVSHGQTTPPGQWHDQERDEWVIVLEGSARLLFEDGREISLERGDHAFLDKHVRHRVDYTSSPCIWLAVHGQTLKPGTLI